MRRVLAVGAVVAWVCSVACDRNPTAPVQPWSREGYRPVTFSGTVREPGGGLLSGVTVSVPDGPRVTTDASGQFALIAPPASALWFQRAGYVSASWTAKQALTQQAGLEIRMQRELHLPVPGSVQTAIFPDDPAYLGDPADGNDYDCRPCKLITLTGPGRPSSRQTRVHIRWSGNVPLSAWAGSFVLSYVNTTVASAITGPGASELTLTVASSPYYFDQLMVGVAPVNGERPAATSPIPVEISIEVP